jgi:heme a synthase
MALPITPARYRAITLPVAFLVAFIIVTGGAVRLTGSGLGCPSWPTCEGGHVVPPASYHAWVEFTNRLVTGLVSAAVIAAVLASLARRPRRRDLTWLSVGLVAGVMGQIVLGGLVVLFHLFPPLVIGHFLLSMTILACGVVLHHRAGLPDDPHHRPVADPALARLGRLVVAGAAVVVVLGTIVTGSGPHPGSNGSQVVKRLPFALHTVARIHGSAVMAFLALVLVTVALLVRWRAPRPVLRRAEVLVAVLVAQAGVGYAQYLTGVPALLVGIHIAGAVAVWVASLRFALGLAVDLREWRVDGVHRADDDRPPHRGARAHRRRGGGARPALDRDRVERPDQPDVVRDVRVPEAVRLQP